MLRRPDIINNIIVIIHVVLMVTWRVFASVTFPFWKVDNWTTSLASQNEFYQLRDGLVTILESGVYMIYAQVYNK